MLWKAAATVSATEPARSTGRRCAFEVRADAQANWHRPQSLQGVESSAAEAIESAGASVEAA